MRGQRILVLVLLAALAATAHAAAAEGPDSSDTCGSCHRDIYRMWRDSAHAKALEDPFFLEPFGKIKAKYGIERTRLCIQCHAPVAGLVDDLALNKVISREGVNCEFCHGLVSVKMEQDGPRYQVEIGPVKRGTIPGADSRGHEVAYSELHADSLVCAPCHEYRTEAGTPILTTYTEWQASSAAERGDTCQHCHMNLVESDVVDPRIKRESGAAVNLHEMPGGHSLQQLHKALRVQSDWKRIDEGLQVTVTMHNDGAGHAVPTGMPGRRIILQVSVRTSEGKTYGEERIYEKQFVDTGGRRLELVADLFFAEGLKLAADTRIAPDEARDERFVFPVPADATAWIGLKLQYEHAPWGEDQDRVWLTFFSETRFVARSS